MYEYTKYITTKDHLLETIEKYGVAILPSVLDDDECSQLVSGLWDYFETLTGCWPTPLNRTRQETWKHIYSLFPLHSMLFQHFSVGQSQACWDLRQNEKIIDIFAGLWKCKPEDLLVSFDGVSFSLPPEVTKRGWNHENTWYHTDQSFTRNNLECIQSWVTGLDVNEGDATLAFLEGSNRFHGEFAKHFQKKDKSDWYKLEKIEEQFYVEKGCTPMKIRCPKGSMVFWDSRTIHCGAEPLKTRKTPNSRAIVYLCYTPRSRATNANLRKKIKAFEELRTTNHYPHKPKLFSWVPRTYGNDMPPINNVPPPILKPIGRRLVGYI